MSLQPLGARPVDPGGEDQVHVLFKDACDDSGDKFEPVKPRRGTRYWRVARTGDRRLMKSNNLDHSSVNVDLKHPYHIWGNKDY